MEGITGDNEVELVCKRAEEWPGGHSGSWFKPGTVAHMGPAGMLRYMPSLNMLFPLWRAQLEYAASEG